MLLCSLLGPCRGELRAGGAWLELSTIPRLGACLLLQPKQLRAGRASASSQASSSHHLAKISVLAQWSQHHPQQCQKPLAPCTSLLPTSSEKAPGKGSAPAPVAEVQVLTPRAGFKPLWEPQPGLGARPWEALGALGRGRGSRGDVLGRSEQRATLGTRGGDAGAGCFWAALPASGRDAAGEPARQPRARRQGGSAVPSLPGSGQEFPLVPHPRLRGGHGAAGEEPRGREDGSVPVPVRGLSLLLVPAAVPVPVLAPRCCSGSSPSARSSPCPSSRCCGCCRVLGLHGVRPSVRSSCSCSRRFLQREASGGGRRGGGAAGWKVGSRQRGEWKE